MRTLPAEATAELARLTADNLRLRRIEDAAREVVALAPEVEPEYEDWGGDSESAEVWGGLHGLWEAAAALRAALGPEDPASAWRRVRGALSGGDFAP